MNKAWLTKSFLLSKPSYCLPYPTFSCIASLVISHFSVWRVLVPLFMQLRTGSLPLLLRGWFADLQAQNFLLWGQPYIWFTGGYWQDKEDLDPVTLESENQWYWCLCQNCSSRAWHSYSWGAVLRKQDQPCVMSCQGSSDKSNSVFFNCLVLSWFLFVAVFLFSLLFGFFLEHFCLRNISDLPSFLFLIVFVWWTARNMHHWKCRNSLNF